MTIPRSETGIKGTVNAYVKAPVTAVLTSIFAQEFGFPVIVTYLKLVGPYLVSPTIRLIVGTNRASRRRPLPAAILVSKWLPLYIVVSTARPEDLTVNTPTQTVLPDQPTRLLSTVPN